MHSREFWRPGLHLPPAVAATAFVCGGGAFGGQGQWLLVVVMRGGCLVSAQGGLLGLAFGCRPSDVPLNQGKPTAKCAQMGVRRWEFLGARLLSSCTTLVWGLGAFW